MFTDVTQFIKSDNGLDRIILIYYTALATGVCWNLHSNGNIAKLHGRHWAKAVDGL